ncbi:MAG: helix-hairpin-helix domain-containing protein [Ferruginibacter sp.]|nr:helix-hairpin-helix domain-containing protein [Ferruginibacter sp.]
MKTCLKISRDVSLLLKAVYNATPSMFTFWLLKIAYLRIVSCSFMCCLIGYCFLPFTCPAQLPEIPFASIVEQQLEVVTENNEDAETEDDSFLQAMRQFLENPVNLNTADIRTLNELMLLSPVQVQNIISYRMLLGNFISVYELQAVPGIDLQLINRLRPYITVSTPQYVIASIGERLKGGTSTILIRVNQVLGEQKGYGADSGAANNSYPGSKQRLFARYTYQFKNLLQFGITCEKDPGEQFFKGSQKNGFDFYSAHLFVRNTGIIKSLALGDFTVNLAQGLTQWQSLAFKKSADVTNIKCQLPVLRPYNSAGEINFHRGIGITVAKNNLEATAFASYKNIDANFVTDTLNNEDFISSLQTSGLHRTKSETADKGVQRQITLGGNLSYNPGRFHFGINGVQYQFKLPVKKSIAPYNIYAISGRGFGNYSADYSFSYRNFHFFGEAAFTNSFDRAFVNGLIISADSKIDMSLLYRNISASYQSLYTNAFTESTFPNNEKGIYAGISVRPNFFWRIDAYADFYKFPWMKYLVDMPSVGKDYLVQASYHPNKQLDMYLRYRSESKSKNFNPNGFVISQVVAKPMQNLRSHINYKINNSVTLRNRVEMLWFDKKGAGAQNGFLIYVDCIIKPLMKRYSGSTRLQYFETEGYDSRLYAYENDVLYSFSIPIFYDKGYRYYVNFNYDVSKKLTVWLRWAQTIYDGKNVIGSGLDEIAGNKRMEVKIQAQYRF